MPYAQIRYFESYIGNELFGLFQSNDDAAINLQIGQLMKVPEMIVKEVDKEQYEKTRAAQRGV